MLIKIKYYKKNIKNIKKNINYGKRGMTFEKMLNNTNKYYLNKNIAVIHKKPTPIQIVKVDYIKKNKTIIKEAYFRQASTTDYNGVYKGFYIDFEAKETKNINLFNLKNIKKHQILHMQNCLKQKGICFILIFFSSLKRCFFIESKIIISYWNKQNSISLNSFKKIGIEINLNNLNPIVPYIKILNIFLKNKKGDFFIKK